MKKVLIGILLATFLTSASVLAQEKVVSNPLQTIVVNEKPRASVTKIETTKVVTQEGTYRIFMGTSVYGVGIAAIKIKEAK